MQIIREKTLTKKNLNFKKECFEYLPQLNVWVSSTENIEIYTTVYSFINPGKAIGSNSIPTKIIKLLTMDILNQLKDFSFSCTRNFSIHFKNEHKLYQYIWKTRNLKDAIIDISDSYQIFIKCYWMVFKGLCNFLEINRVIYSYIPWFSWIWI